MRSLVTGGAGFIGSHLVDSLVELGHEVLVIDNLSSGRRENVNPRAELKVLDICDEEAIFKSIHDFSPNYIHHYAAQIDARLSVKKPSYDARINIIGSINVIKAGVKAGAEKFIYISSGGAIYGEPLYCPVPEDHPINPVSPYGLSKYTVEEYLRLIHCQTNLPYVCLRYPNVYGPRQDPHGEAGVLAIFSQAMLEGKPLTIFGDGSATRDYLFVSDVVRSNLLVTNNVPTGSYNIGSGVETSVKEIFHLLADALSYKKKPTYSSPKLGDINHICLDCNKAKKELGWEPIVNLKEGIDLLLQSLSD